MAGLTAAFKEWAIAVEALLSGDLILLLRKGGLREKAGQLQVQVGNRGWAVANIGASAAPSPEVPLAGAGCVSFPRSPPSHCTYPTGLG
jgi:hypothetical protein